MLSRPCNVDSLTTHCYIVKLGVTGVHIFFLIFDLKQLGQVSSKFAAAKNGQVSSWLVDLILNVPVNNFSVMLGRSHHFLGITSTFGE